MGITSFCNDQEGWLSQFFILASIIALVARTAFLKNDTYTPASMLGTVCLIIVWHQQDFRSSKYIFTLYIFSLTGAAINIRTMSLLNQASQDQVKAFIAQGGCYEKANLFSRISFHFLQPILREGYKGPLTSKDIEGMMPHRIKTEYSHELLNNRWQRAVTKAQSHDKKPSLFITIMRTYSWSWTQSQPSDWQPLILHMSCRSYSSDEHQPVSLGIILAFGMFFSSVLSAFCVGHFYQTAIKIGVEIRTVLIAMVYRKSLRLSNAAKQSNTAGEISNHMSVDAERWLQAVTSLPTLVSIPYEIAIALWLCFIVKAYMKAKVKKLAAAGNRVRLMNEILAGIKIVKFYGWEDSFKQRVTTYRDD
ncbi:hypothetical protein BGZ96_009692 [Linnemannia gamsii]|uniref:ABC transmembrane type-1 domain-containing protein n=1 Tax=Linnemannia gamsii TaxID=64522 RepID=A0ABQ7KHD7_9FUNG|nr:hypothetical protein BGZ96_009692 [Linnemannia gamsii]